MLRKCLYCGKHHKTQKNRELCQDRYEANYDELNALLADDPLDHPENREAWLHVFRGGIDDLDSDDPWTRVFVED